MLRNQHKFEFEGQQIAAAARTLRDHSLRLYDSYSDKTSEGAVMRKLRAEEFDELAKLYTLFPVRKYELDAEDVYFFRLHGG